MVRLEYNSDDFVGVWVYEFTFQYGAIGIKGTGLTLLVVFYLHSSMVRLECVLAWISLSKLISFTFQYGAIGIDNFPDKIT